MIGVNYQVLFEKSNDGILVHDTAKDIIVSVNEKALELLDKTEQEILGQPPIQYFSENKQNPQYKKGSLDELVEQTRKEEAITYKRVHYRKDQTPILLEVSAYLMPPPQDNLHVITYRDITENKKQKDQIFIQNQVLIDQNLKLTQYINSNKQLQNFAYLAAHDLKAPIRSVGDFAELLIKDIQKENFDNLLEYATFINKKSIEMQSLIQSILSLAQINNTALNIDTFNPADLFISIEKELQKRIQEKNAIIHIEQLPKQINADKTQFKQVFCNIINNALKYQKKDNQPIIHIRTENLDKSWVFIIKDNGIGIEEKDYEKIFILFKRLHSNNEYEGTGIGLALCKKIIQKHQGKIWVTSTQHEGTSFFIKIPKQLP